MPEERRARQLRDEHEEQHRVERLLRVLEHLGEAARTLLALLGERDRSDPVHPDERRLGHREVDGEEEEDDDCGEEQPVDGLHQALSGGAPGADPASSAARNRSSSSRSRRCIRCGVLGLGVVVLEQVQDAVDDEERDLVLERAAEGRRLSAARPPGTPARRRGSSAARRPRRACRGPVRPRRAGGPAAAARRRAGTRARRSARRRRGSAR